MLLPEDINMIKTTTESLTSTMIKNFNEDHNIVPVLCILMKTDVNYTLDVQDISNLLENNNSKNILSELIQVLLNTPNNIGIWFITEAWISTNPKYVIQGDLKTDPEKTEAVLVSIYNKIKNEILIYDMDKTDINNPILIKREMEPYSVEGRFANITPDDNSYKINMKINLDDNIPDEILNPSLEEQQDLEQKLEEEFILAELKRKEILEEND